MPERRFETAYWSDPFVMKLPAKAKLLYVYLWTNIHCNQAGLYEIAPETISFETGLALEEVPELMHLLGPKVTWHPEQNLVWAKNFLRRQTRSPQFLIAAAKCLETIKNNGLIREFLDYNQKYNLSIPYQYPIDRVAVSDSDTPSSSYPYTGSNADKKTGGSLFGSFSLLRSRLLKASSSAVDHLAEHEMIKQELSLIGRECGLEPRSEYQITSGRVDLCFFKSGDTLVAAFEIDVYEPRAKSLVKLATLDCPFKCIILRTGVIPHSIEQGVHLIGLGIGQEIETGEAVPSSKSENGENLSKGDREVISTWRSVKGFNMNTSDASELVARMRTEFTGVDILPESKKWAARKLSEPLTKKSRPSQQLWAWMEKAREFAQERSAHESKGQRVKGARPASDFTGKW